MRAVGVGERAKEYVYRHAPARRRLQRGKPQMSIDAGEVFARGDDVDVVGRDGHAVLGLDDGHRGVAGEEFGQGALVLGGEVEHDDEDQPGVGGHGLKEAGESLDAARRAAQADHGRQLVAARGHDVVDAPAEFLFGHVRVHVRQSGGLRGRRDGIALVNRVNGGVHRPVIGVFDRHRLLSYRVLRRKTSTELPFRRTVGRSAAGTGGDTASFTARSGSARACGSRRALWAGRRAPPASGTTPGRSARPRRRSPPRSVRATPRRGRAARTPQPRSRPPPSTRSRTPWRKPPAQRGQTGSAPPRGPCCPPRPPG